jgi:hypothetical protein
MTVPAAAVCLALADEAEALAELHRARASELRESEGP